MMNKLMMLMLAFVVWQNTALAAGQVGEQAPNFTLQQMDGKTFSLADFKGKQPVHLIFWATWCPNCKHEIPELKRIYHEFNGKMATLAINVSINDSKEKALRYIKKYKLPYPVAFDENATVTHQYDVMGTPTQIIIDAQGIIRYRDAVTPKDLATHFDTLATAH